MINKLSCNDKKIRILLEEILFERYINNESFLKDINNALQHYNVDLFKMTPNEKTEFFVTNLFNGSRGYIIRLVILKHLYFEAVDSMNYFIDEFLLPEVKKLFE